MLILAQKRLISKLIAEAVNPTDTIRTEEGKPDGWRD